MTGEELRGIRRALGLTQADFGALLGMRQQGVSRLESGARGITRQVARAARLALDLHLCQERVRSLEEARGALPGQEEAPPGPPARS